MQEVTGQDAGRLDGQELPLARRRPPPRRTEADGVPGVTIGRNRRYLGNTPARAASTARSAQSGLGRATCRRGTATSCRKTKISASRVTAVEPSERMRGRLAPAVPGALVLAGSVEKIPLEDGTVDAVLIGQVWLQVANGAI
jgi:Methyltransferase domain